MASASPAVQTPADELPAIPAVEDDLKAGAKAPPHTAIHNGLNRTQEETEERPVPSTEPNSVITSPPTLAVEPLADVVGFDKTEDQRPSPELARSKQGAILVTYEGKHNFL